MSVQRLIDFIESGHSADPISVLVGDCDNEIRTAVMQITSDLGGNPNVVARATVAGASLYMLVLFMRYEGKP